MKPRCLAAKEDAGRPDHGKAEVFGEPPGLEIVARSHGPRRRRHLVIQGGDCWYVLLRNVLNQWRPAGRVGRWRGGRRFRLGCVRRFRLRARLGVAIAPFPAPPHRTVHEVLPHTALREPSPDGVQRM